MRKLIVYFSYTGGTRLMAESAASVLGADLAEIHLQKPLSKFLPWVYFWGGMQAVMRVSVPILPLEHNPEAYDAILIGTPVWGSSVVPAVRSWLAQQRLQGKTIACFASGGSGEAGKTFSEMHALLPGNKFLPDLVIKEDKSSPLTAARLVREWLYKLPDFE